MSRNHSFIDNLAAQIVPVAIGIGLGALTHWLATSTALPETAIIASSVFAGVAGFLAASTITILSRLDALQSLVANNPSYPVSVQNLTPREALRYVIDNAGRCKRIKNNRFRANAPSTRTGSWGKLIEEHDRAIGAAVKKGVLYTLICDEAGLREAPTGINQVYLLRNAIAPLSMTILEFEDGRVEVLAGWGSKGQSLDTATVYHLRGEQKMHFTLLAELFAEYQAAAELVPVPTALQPA